MRTSLSLVLAILLAPFPAAADVLEKIRTTGEIRLGVRKDAPPFSYLNANAEPAGLAVRLCEEVAGRIAGYLNLPELSVEHRVVSASERFDILAEGLTDLHCGPASATLSRRETMDFSILYFVDGAAIAEREAGYEGVFARGAGRFGVLAGTTTVGIARDLAERNGVKAEIIEFPAHNRGLLALDTGQVDLYFGDQAILLFQIDKLGLAGRIGVQEEILSFEPYALVMRRGEHAMRLAVDRALSEIYAEGLIYELIEDELDNYPLPPEARAVYEIVGLPE